MMKSTTRPVGDCGPRCGSVLLGFLVLGAMSAWVANSVGQPEFMFLGMVGIGAGLVMTSSLRVLLPMGIATFLIALFTLTISDGNVFKQIPSAFLAALGITASSTVPWLLLGLGKIKKLQYPMPMHFAVLLLLAIPSASFLAAICLLPYFGLFSTTNTGSSLLNIVILQVLSMTIVMPVTLVLFGERPNSRFDHLRMLELTLGSLLIVAIETTWLIHHHQSVTYFDWLLPLQATIVLIPLVWLATRLGLFGASVGILVLGISTMSVHATTNSWHFVSQDTLLTQHFADEIILLGNAIITLTLGATTDQLAKSRANAIRSLNEVQSLVDTSATGIIRTTCDGTILYTNNHGPRMLNTDESIIGSKIQAFIQPDHHNQVEAMLQSARMTSVVEFELPLISGNNSRLWRLAVATYQPPTEGREEYCTISIIDLSSARQREESRLRSESERLQREAQEHLANLTSAMLSDANNLAMAVSGTATRARNTADLNPSMFQDVLHRIEAVCIETSSMFERYRRASGSILPDSNDRCDPKKIVKETVKQHEVNPRLTVKLTTDGDSTIACDESFLRFAIDQVILNSLEASSTKMNLNISIKQQPREGVVKIQIQDDGPGITIEDLPKVTNPFFTHKSRGRGLGLPTIESGLQILGGWMKVESQPKIGTKVTLAFPYSHSFRIETEDSSTLISKEEDPHPAGLII